MMAEPYEVLLLLGGNLGDPKTTFERAEELIALRAGPILARSRDHLTEPWGFSDERLFLNRALLVETSLDPAQLMKELLAVEQALGRKREPGPRYASRTIDIDILLIGDRVIDLPELKVPHPRLHERAFALAPAADLVPLAIHPLLKRTVLDLLNDLRQRR